MIDIKIILIIVMLIFIFVLHNNNKYNCENLTETSNSAITNEGVQNMASVLNSGQGTVTNLQVNGYLQIGNVKLSSNADGTVQFGSSKLLSDGSIQVGSTKILSDGTIQFGTSKLTPDGNINVGKIAMNNDGTINSPILKWNSGGANWQINPEGSTFVIRNTASKVDSRVAIMADNNLTVSMDLLSPGNISGNTLNVPSYTIQKYPTCGGNGFGILNTATGRVYSMWDNHMRTVTNGTCTDSGRMDL